jgi:hypothetical protein
MKIELIDGEETARQVGAAVVRSVRNGEITLDLGPADGAALFSLRMGHAEATRLISALREVVSNGGESVLIVDD